MSLYEPAAGLLTPQEMYRAVSDARDLPDNFSKSLRAYVFYLERGHDVYDVVTDNYYSPAWGVALRTAIGQAEEWLVLGKTFVEHYYYGVTLMRQITSALCRDTVPLNERIF